MAYAFQQLLNILQQGSIYAMISLGYSLVYGILLLINFAHGDVFMIGAFVYFISVTVFGLGFLPSLLSSIICCAILGALIEFTAYRPLRNAPKMSAVITALGVGMFLENITLALSPYSKHIPTVIVDRVWHIGDVTFSSIQTIIISISIFLMVMLDIFVRRTPIGMAIRAISWDIKAVPLMGVPVNRIVSITFAIGAGMAGAAGVFYASAYPVIDPYMGIMAGWKAFIAAVVGGIGNIRGAMIGGYLLGGIETLCTIFFPSTYRDFISFLLLFILLIIRPYGLFGRDTSAKL